MGLTVVVLLIAGFGGWLSGGRGRGIRGHQLRSPGLVLAAATVLFCEPLVASSVRHAYPTAVLMAAVLMLQFGKDNLDVPGVALATLGLLLNAVVVVANGSMPVEQSAAYRAGVGLGSISAHADHRHFLADTDTWLRPLDDRVAVPLPGHREVDSLGDVAIAAGVGLCLFTALRRRRGVFDPAAPWVLQQA